MGKRRITLNIVCPICKRDVPEKYQEEHHLIPKSLQQRKKYKPFINSTIIVCVNCADEIHQLFTEKELAENYNTLEKLLNNERIQKWANWVSKKTNDFSVCMRAKKKR